MNLEDTLRDLSEGRLPSVDFRPEFVPISLATANDFVATYHRHNGRTARNGGKFAVGLARPRDSLLCAVAIVGNPVSATLMDGFTAEVLRVCTSPYAPKNACSMLYGRCWKIWRSMGGERLVTYTLQAEQGSSLNASGFKIVGEVASHDRWMTRKNEKGLDRKAQAIYGVDKFRWQLGIASGKQKPHFERDLPDAPAKAWSQK